jgi:acetyl-CoA carboxylase biotin carboxylase subunit
MGSKTAARRAAIAAGVAVVPGTEQPLTSDATDEDVARIAERIGYPVMVKAVAGGGGKGMRLVDRPGDLPGAIRAARSEAQSAFGDSAIYLERWLSRPRHIEIQILADQHGTVVPFVERECSIQRRHQKVIEESPSVAVSAGLRDRLTAAAAAVARAVGYTSAGTIEFLLAEDGAFHFLEMNTRLQVEHPVTEMVTGIDLVAWQIRIARGERLTVDAAAAVRPRGHAIECRIYAEDPAAGFMPSPGRITALRVPDGPGIRDDSGVEPGAEIPIFYDPLVSKLIAWGEDRPQAIARMQRALREYDVRGIRTTLDFFRWMLRQPAFLEGDLHTGTLDDLLQQGRATSFFERDPSLEEVALVAAAVHAASGRSQVPAPTRFRDRAEPVLPARPQRWKSQARIEGLRG